MFNSKILLIVTQIVVPLADKTERCEYRRPAGTLYELETEISLRQEKQHYVVTSVTSRGASQLLLSSRFDLKGELQSARVSFGTEIDSRVAVVKRKRNHAEVLRADGMADLLDCPSNVIVTSAPDWTDAFMLMRRYDSEKGGPQVFAGLWIHPTNKPLRIVFKVEPLGRDKVEREGTLHSLERFKIVLRNESKYVAWRDKSRRLVRLVPDKRVQPAIVLAGWEDATTKLKP